MSRRVIGSNLSFPKSPVFMELRTLRKKQGDHLRGHCSNLGKMQSMVAWARIVTVEMVKTAWTLDIF